MESIKPNRPGVPERVTKAIVKDMDSFVPPENFVVPMVGAVPVSYTHLDVYKRQPVLSALLAWHLPHLARRIGT